MSDRIRFFLQFVTPLVYLIMPILQVQTGQLND